MKKQKIILIACCAQKQQTVMQAKQLYQSPLFKKSWDYAQKIGYDKIYILSAKHHLLNPLEEIAPYDLTLNEMRVAEKKQWASDVKEQMKEEGLNLAEDEFVFLAGTNYYKYLVGDDGIQHYSTPFKPFKGIGYILQFLSHETRI
ncbi:hypothetical protein A4G19_05590 [Pasteurellaceae bacterium Macca]|nr:hypothetical protein [Pasteurellaceae bacterium Macca]